jgi:hypothetical protein
LSNFQKAILIFCGAVLALSELGFKVSALVAGLGLTGFVLGFALKDVGGDDRAVPPGRSFILARPPANVARLYKIFAGTATVLPAILIRFKPLSFIERGSIVLAAASLAGGS